MTERTKQALRNFAAGYNCAQSVYMAYADVAGLTQEQAARVSAGFGGGIGRLRDNCGAFSAAVMLCGTLEEKGNLPNGRPQVYARVQEVHRCFVERCGTISCAELLKRHPKAEAPTPEERTPAYYASRPCARVILQACRIIEEQMCTCAEPKGRCPFGNPT
ncbi:MAG: C_GCAxxG_C_C family protein [Clostridia bacterium]|nr:C_GCAxxG_C_C family protein [Clostridia bacterium]